MEEDDRTTLGDIATQSALIAGETYAISRLVAGPVGGALIAGGRTALELLAKYSREQNAIIDEDVVRAFGDANVDAATALRGFTQVYEENFDQFLYDPDGTRKRRSLPANYANTRFAQAMTGMPEELRLSEFQQWQEMAKDVMDRSEGDKAELARNLIRARRTFAEGPRVHARDEMITGDLDAIDRLALVGTDIATRKRIAGPRMAAAGTHIKVEDDSGSFFDDLGFVQGVAKPSESVIRTDSFRDALEIAAKKMAAAGTYFKTTDHRGGIFESVEVDLGLMGDTASRVAATTAGPASQWVGYRERGQVPFQTNEGLAAGAWSLEDSMAHTRDWTSGLPDTAGAAGGGLDDLGGELAHTANSALRMQDAFDGAGVELWELETPLLRTRDGAVGLANVMGGDGLTGAMDIGAVAADGLALSTGTAEQALAAAGLSGAATTEVLGLMRSAGLDPTTSAWGELAAAVHVWGDATDTEVGRVIGRLGDLARVQGGGGPGTAGSSRSGGSGSGSAGVDLGQLMSLAQRVAQRRADMGDLNPQHRAHELGKVRGQLGAPGSLAEKLALLRAFFAGSAHGISFGLGPSAGSLGVNIPQFAAGGTVPGPLGAPQLIVAHGGEHIVPHRATGSPTIIRIELDREVLSQAVLGDLLRLQGREVTLGLS